MEAGCHQPTPDQAWVDRCSSCGVGVPLSHMVQPLPVCVFNLSLVNISFYYF